MNEQYPDVIEFDYVIKFSKKDQTYRLVHYNTPWDGCDRELEDVRLMFEGKTLDNQEFLHYKVINWEQLDDGQYEANVKMKLVKNRDKDMGHDQFFKLTAITKVGL